MTALFIQESVGHRGVGELTQGLILVNGGDAAFPQKIWDQSLCSSPIFCSLPKKCVIRSSTAFVHIVCELSVQNLPFVGSKFPTVLSWEGFHYSRESYSLNKVEPQRQEGKGLWLNEFTPSDKGYGQACICINNRNKKLLSRSLIHLIWRQVTNVWNR